MTSTGITPYVLTFDHNAIIPGKLTIQSLRRAKQSSMNLNDY